MSYTFAYYVSGHGFGHATRSSEVIRELAAHPATKHVHICATVPPFLFDRPAIPKTTYRKLKRGPDAAAVQKDGATMDVRATLQRFRTFMEDDYPQFVAEETRWIETERVDMVLADAPFAVCRAAANAGVPAALIANFLWDDIYRDMLAMGEFGEDGVSVMQKLVEQATLDYKVAKCVLRWPGWIDMVAFATETAIPLERATFLCLSDQTKAHLLDMKLIELPLLARASIRPRQVIRQHLKADLLPENKLLLVAFGGHSFSDIKELLKIAPVGWTVSLVAHPSAAIPSDWINVSPDDVYVPDMIEAADVVVGKLVRVHRGVCTY